MACPPTIPQGSKGRLFVRKEATYAERVDFVAGDAVRFEEGLQLSFNPYNWEAAAEHKGSPSAFSRRRHKPTASFAIGTARIFPSGTRGVAPEAGEIFAAALGDEVIGAAATALSGTPTPTTGTVDDATGIGVGTMLSITSGGQPYVVMVTALTGADLTWTPALPAAPTAGETVEGVVAYTLTNELCTALSVGHDLTGSTSDRTMYGVGIDTLTLALDHNSEPTFSCGGPGSVMVIPSDPAWLPFPATATVGGVTNAPYGGVGAVAINGSPYRVKTIEVSLANNLKARNSEIGVEYPTEVYRGGRRTVDVSLSAWAEDQSRLFAQAMAGVPVTLDIQIGRTPGNIIAVHLPRVDFDVPEQDDPETEVSWSFTGTALESAFDAGDELALAFA